MAARIPPAPSWAARASCKGQTPLFYPDRGDDAADAVQAAKAICRNCPVSEPCLTYALEGGEQHGVWGGLTVRERRYVRRHGKAEAA